jgi:hypothetical protein
MYFIEWRGYGLLGIVPLIVGVVTLGFMIDFDFKAAALAGVLVMALAGAGMAVLGWVLNRHGNHHSLYGLPLWVWGAASVVLGLTLAGMVAASVIQSGWKG